MHIFPAIDLKQDECGRCRCVRLLQGRADAETEFSDDPPAIARRWAGAGAQWLHVVDLDGAFGGQPVNANTIAEIVAAFGGNVQIGGGIRDDDSVENVLEKIGAKRVVVGTQAVADLTWLASVCERYPGRIVGGVDARDGRVAIEGWTRDSGLEALDVAERLAGSGVAAIVFTDIATDGMMTGPNVEATRQLAEKIDVPVIASGGVSTLDDVRRLTELPLEGIIIGKALYAEAIDLAEAVKLAADSQA